MRRRFILRVGTITLLALIVAGCASDNVSAYGSVHYGYGSRYYDPWYRHDVIVRPPPPDYRPRPENPIYRPPPSRPPRPTPLPARPMPRPALR